MEKPTNKKYYTQMPNQLMQIIMSKATNASVKAVLTVIARKTYGFQKETDEISLTQFERETKLSRPTVVDALARLKEVGLIIQLSKGRSKYTSNEWKIDLTNWEDKLVKLPKLVKNSDNGVASQLVKPDLHTKESQKKFNNYLPISSSSKETTFGGKSQPLSKTQPQEKNPKVIFLSNLNRAKKELDNYLSKLSSEELVKEKWSLNTTPCIKGVHYYLWKYKATLGIDHVICSVPQIKDCLTGFLDEIWELERLNLPISIDEVIQKAIDHWFATTSLEENNLRLSHFVGNASLVFYNSLVDVLSEIGFTRKELEDVNP